MGELDLAALAFLYVLDVREQKPGAVCGVGDDGVAQGHPDVGVVAAAESQFRATALRRGPQQRADVLGVDQVGEGVAAHRGGWTQEQAAERVVGAEDPPVLVAAHLGDGHAGGGVLEGLPETLLARPQRLLFALQPDKCTLHIRS